MFLGAAPTMRRWVGRSRFAVVEFATPAQAKAASQALDDGSKWCAEGAVGVTVWTAVLCVLVCIKRITLPHRGGMRAAVFRPLDASPREDKARPKHAPPTISEPDRPDPGAAQAPSPAAHPARKERRDYRTWASAASGAGPGAKAPSGPKQAVAGEKGFGLGRGAALAAWPLAPGSQ